MVSTLKEFAIGVCLATTTAKRQKNINEFVPIKSLFPKIDVKLYLRW